MPPLYEIDCCGTQVSLGSGTRIMGILNVTPDSFSDGGSYFSLEKAVDQAEKMVEEGADFIDIGGESSRPSGPYGEGARVVTIEEEIRRTAPIIEKLATRISQPISIDTTKSAVAKFALDAGATMVNDISALRFDSQMAAIVAESGAPVILMHMQGTPQTMQDNPIYHHLMDEICQFLTERRGAAKAGGISSKQILLDPGLGFGKLHRHNYEILANLSRFQDLDCPVLIGPSRKQFVGPEFTPQERLEGTLAALVFCVLGGAQIVRVHDVAAARKAIQVAEKIASYVISDM